MNMPTTFFGWVAFLVEKYFFDFLRGLGVTLELAIIGTILGCLIGFVVGVVRSVVVDQGAPLASRGLMSALKAILAVYVEIFRGTPMMVQATVVYYGTMSLWGIDIPSFSAGVLVLALNIGAYMSESVRGAISGIDPGQIEGGQAVGMSYAQIMYHVIMPQAFKNLIPQIGNTFISAIKDTSVLNVIAVTELYFAAKSVAGTYYKFFETYLIICAIYFVLTFTMSRLLQVLGRVLEGSRNYELILDEEDEEEVTES
ncbi:MAG TPA: amino acid ABC transporter permease [Bacillota bacterium]|nr:amino acid ABC transporter permease [Bacillota bacterium]